jgi:hypothetical protein
MAGRRWEAGFVWRFVVPSMASWLAFVAVLLLVPAMGNLPFHNAARVLATAPLYAVLIAPVACLPGLFISRRSLLATWTVLLAAIAADSAFAMVVTDGQGSIAMLIVWFLGLLLAGPLGLVEWVLRRTRRAVAS